MKEASSGYFSRIVGAILLSGSRHACAPDARPIRERVTKQELDFKIDKLGKKALLLACELAVAPVHDFRLSDSLVYSDLWPFRIKRPMVLSKSGLQSSGILSQSFGSIPIFSQSQSSTQTCDNLLHSDWLLILPDPIWLLCWHSVSEFSGRFAVFNVYGTGKSLKQHMRPTEIAILLILNSEQRLSCHLAQLG